MVLKAGVRKNKLLTRAAACLLSNNIMMRTAAIESTTTAHANENQTRAVE
jgi:hypothetical protein